MKECRKCNIIKEDIEFNFNSSNKDKLGSYCKICNRINNSKWSKSNPRNRSEYNKIWRLNNKDYVNLKYKEKYNNDINFKLSQNIRNLISISIKRNGYKKSSKTNDILGCSFEEFKLHIESKFEMWMTWENRGLYNGELNYGWDIDHIIPISTAVNEEELLKLNHYTNLQPLCSKINRDIKKDILIWVKK